MYVLSTNTSVKFWLGKDLLKVLLMALRGLWLGCYFPLPIHQFYFFLTLIAKVTTSLPSPTPNIQCLFQLKALSSSESVHACKEQPERDMEVPKSVPWIMGVLMPFSSLRVVSSLCHILPTFPSAGHLFVKYMLSRTHPTPEVLCVHTDNLAQLISITPSLGKNEPGTESKGLQFAGGECHLKFYSCLMLDTFLWSQLQHIAELINLATVSDTHKFSLFFSGWAVHEMIWVSSNVFVIHKDSQNSLDQHFSACDKLRLMICNPLSTFHFPWFVICLPSQTPLPLFAREWQKLYK